jgi:hypothetical protein
VHPTSGARLVLELDGGAPAGEVAYRVAIYTPSEAFGAVASVTLVDGEVALSAWEPPEPPPWAVELLRRFLRSEWRARQGGDPAPWPQRLNRWRAERA